MLKLYQNITNGDTGRKNCTKDMKISYLHSKKGELAETRVTRMKSKVFDQRSEIGSQERNFFSAGSFEHV